MGPRALLLSILSAGLAVAPGGSAGAAGEPVPTTAPKPGTTAPDGTTPTTSPGTSVPPTSSPGRSGPEGAKPDDHLHGENNALSPEQTRALEAEVATLTDGQRALLRQLQAAREALAVRRFALATLAREVATARQRLEAASAVERTARAKVEETTRQVQRLKDEIVALAAAAYRNHAESWALGAIGSLDVGSANTLTRANTYARSDAAFLGVRLDDLTVLRRRLEGERRVAETARAEAEASAAELDARLVAHLKTFSDATDAAARVQSAVARSFGSTGGLVALLVDPQFGADDISGVLAAVQAGQGDPPTIEGIFAVPIPDATLSSPYGLRIDPFSGEVASHAGLDFAASSRTPVLAAASGVVVVAGDCGGYGICVVLDHGNSLATLYGHLSETRAAIGATVSPGEVIGLVGSTGISTGPHLHFEVRLRGRPIDPVPTLRG